MDMVDSGDWMINYNEVIKDKSLSYITRLLAADLINNPYLTLGDFFKNLADVEVDILVEKADHLLQDDEEHFKSLEEMIILTMMLCQAEGVSLSSEQDIREATNLLAIITHGVSLGKKGIVEVKYDKLSLGKEFENEVVFKRI